jgi:DNA-binding PadR family transcriptional regulator
MSAKKRERRINAILEILAKEGSRNIYELQKRLEKLERKKISYGRVWECLEQMEKDRLVEFTRVERRAKKYYLTENGLIEARAQGYITYEEFIKKLVNFTQCRVKKLVPALFELAKRSGIVSALLSLPKFKDKKCVEYASSLLMMAFSETMWNRSYDFFIGEEKSPEHYTDKAIGKAEVRIFRQFFPLLSKKEKVELVSSFATKDYDRLMKAIEEDMKRSEELMEMFKKGCEEDRGVLDELKKLRKHVRSKH